MTPLELKRSQNVQRRELAAIAETIPQNLLRWFDVSQFEYQETIYEKHPARLFPEFAGDTAFLSNYASHEYREFDNLTDLAAYLETQNLDYSQDCLVSLGNASAFLRIEKANIAPFLADYLEAIRTEYIPMTLFQSDFATGMAIKHYVGYLEKPTENHLEETVLVISIWRSKAN